MTLTVESWIEALESGKYEQSEGQLRKDGGFCCLGVACELSGLGSWNDGDDRYQGYGFSNLSELPPPLRTQLMLSTDCGQFRFSDLPEYLKAELRSFNPNEYSAITLADLNDEGCPFPLIAKVIRARPKGLFREDVA